ncbi:MAG TPA: MarR family winged helix-turn-helix transcriptional regulator [Streptosporangiaceae bacterium]|jgi:DNA-binding MarR family transcriptional regulator
MEAETAVGSLPANAGYLLSRVGTAVQAGFKDVLARWQIRPLHFLVLTALRGADGVSQQELGQATHVNSGNMVELIDTLERLGYAERRRDPRDRRRHLVAMTGPGRAAFAAMTAAADEHTTRFLQPLSQKEQATLISVLTKLYVTTPEGRARPPAARPAGRQP